MARQLPPVGLAFAESAPLCLPFTRQLAAPPQEVYRALAEEVREWPEWFSAVLRAEPTEAGRDIALKGGIRFGEKVVAAVPGERYAYTMLSATVPVRAMLEDWRLTPADGGGTQVRWTMAVDAAGPVLALMKLGRSGIGRAFGDALRTLDGRLSARA